MSTTDTNKPEASEPREHVHFIEAAIREDLAQGRYQGVHTRFPPEPNGYLHIGHVKAVWINFSLAEKFGGACNLRFDDTNPSKEETEFVDAIQEDIRWLGFDWGENLFFASGWFEDLYRLRRGAGREGARLRRRPDGRGDERLPPGAEGQPLPWALGRGEPRPPAPHARRRVPRWRSHAARQDRHDARRTSTCATRCCTASCARITTARATSGASTRCTTSPTASATRSRARQPLAVQPRVREPPPALRLVRREPRASPPARARSSSRAST